MTIKTAFIGLGVMGYPMAGHLSKAGFEVCVYNRTRARAEQWVEQYPGRVADTPGRATVGSDLFNSRAN
ncbi:MAG TPA: oxidoreductase, partial [Porticoccaceae bacterium]|nr:oxidoreductase [Porticoccaceae bacterium]